MTKKIFALGFAGRFAGCRLRDPEMDPCGLPGLEPSPRVREQNFPARTGGSLRPLGTFDHFTIRRLNRKRRAAGLWSPTERGNRFSWGTGSSGRLTSSTWPPAKPNYFTCGFGAFRFLRVHYLKDGDYLLLGPGGRRQTNFPGPGLVSIPVSGGWRRIGKRARAGSGRALRGGSRFREESRRLAYRPGPGDSRSFPSALYVAEVTPDGRIVNRRAGISVTKNLIRGQDFLPGRNRRDHGPLHSTYEASALTSPPAA